MNYRILGGAKLLDRIREKVSNEIHSLNGKVYLKPVHIVVVKKSGLTKKYVYINRYWWRIKYSGKRKSTSKIKWKYLGKSISIKNEYGLKFKIIGNDIVIDEKSLTKLREILGDLIEEYEIVKER